MNVTGTIVMTCLNFMTALRHKEEAVASYIICMIISMGNVVQGG